MLTPEDKVESFFEEAARIYGETGDSTMAEDFGLMEQLPRRAWHYAGRVFHVVRESEKEVYLGLRCPTHFHKVFYIGPYDGDDYEDNDEEELLM